jgi:uncharacterized protein with PQ loop repeat
VTDSSLPVLAGSVSTVLFVASTLPMLVKAARTRDLGSYSVGNLVLANVANVVHSFYVFNLPVGPIWALHSFYLVTSFTMLIMWLNYCRRLRLCRQPPVSSSRIDDGATVQNASRQMTASSAVLTSGRSTPSQPR